MYNNLQLQIHFLSLSLPPSLPLLLSLSLSLTLPPFPFLSLFPLSLTLSPSLPQGEYLAPEKIENVYITARYVAQAYLYGDSLKSCAVAIIVPDEEVVSAWAKESNVSGNFAELCTNDVRMRSSLVVVFFFP